MINVDQLSSDLWRCNRGNTTDHAFAELVRLAGGTPIWQLFEWIWINPNPSSWYKIEGTVGHVRLKEGGLTYKENVFWRVSGSELVRVLAPVAARRRGRVGRAPGSSPPG